MNPTGQEVGLLAQTGFQGFPAVQVPDHTLIRKIGGGSYGEIWLARNALGTYRAVKIVYRKNFAHERPFEREFSGIKKYEPISRSEDGLMDILQVGRNDEAGYFYYVMELADDVASGTTIDPETYEPRTLSYDILKRGRLPFEECLTIGLALTSALAHLHKNGLVHRDVKPSNVIFVNGVPELADIGLVTEIEEARSYVGTEGFIPPEGPGAAQADIYSLGKVLYEISTGKDRFDYPELPASLGDTESQHELIELNEIVIKSCRADPHERYQTADKMHADLLLLQRGRSIKHVRKLQRRLAVATRVGMVAIVASLLALGAWLGSIKQIRRARDAERRAETEKKEALAETRKRQQVAQLLKDMLEAAGPSIALGRDTTLLKDIAGKTERRLEKELNGQPEVEAELRTTLGDLYLELADFGKAAAMHRRALELLQATSKGKSTEAALSIQRLGWVLYRQNKIAEAEASLRAAIAMLRELPGDNRKTLAATLVIFSEMLAEEMRCAESERFAREAMTITAKLQAGGESVHLNGTLALARALWRQGKAGEAEPLFLKGLEIKEKSLGSEHPEVASLKNDLAQVLTELNRMEAAEHYQRQALGTLRKVAGDEHPEVATCWHNLGLIIAYDHQRLPEAEKCLRTAVGLRTRSLPPEHPATAQSLVMLAQVLSNEGVLVEAGTLMKDAIAIQKQALGNNHPELGYSLATLGSLLIKQGKLVEAVEALEAGHSIWKKTLGPEHPHLGVSLGALSQVLQKLGRFAEAEATLAQARAILKKARGDAHPEVAAVVAYTADLLSDQGRFAEAEPFAREAMAITERICPDRWPFPQSQASLGGTLLGQSNYADAEPLLLAGCNGMSQRLAQMPPDAQPHLGRAMTRLVKLYSSTGRPDRAAEWEKKLADFNQAAGTNSLRSGSF